MMEGSGEAAFKIERARLESPLLRFGQRSRFGRRDTVGNSVPLYSSFTRVG